MPPLKPLIVAILSALLITAAHAQVGVEAGILTAGSAGAVNPLQKLGAAMSRSVFSSTRAIPAAPGKPAAATAPVATSLFSLSAGQPSCTRSFAPQAAGSYVVGVQWQSPPNVSVTLQVGEQKVTGSTAAPLTLRFSAKAYTLCQISLQASGAATTVTGDLQVMREPAAGEPPSKSLLTSAERLARRGCRPSLLPLIAQLAQRHLKTASPTTDLDQLFAASMKSAPDVTPADLQALVRDCDALPEATRVQSITAATRILRTLPDPTLAGMRSVLAQPQPGRGGYAQAPAGHSRPGGGLGIAAPAPAGPPAIAAVQPLAEAYPPGANIRLIGQNFAPQPERNQVYLGTDLSRLLSGRPLCITAASTTELQVQLPADLPDGQYNLLVMVDRRQMSGVRSLRISQNAPPPAAEPVQTVRPCHYRLSLTRLECLDETNPEWWTQDAVALVATAVADGQSLTRALGPQPDFGDGTTWDIPAEKQCLTETAGSSVTEGLGLAVELWQWQAPTASLGPWAVREAFANALAAPHPRFDDPKPQDDVSSELSVSADLIGREQLVWTAQQLQALLQPGQTQTKTLDLRLAPTPEQSDATGHYRLTVQLERLD